MIRHQVRCHHATLLTFKHIVRGFGCCYHKKKIKKHKIQMLHFLSQLCLFFFLPLKAAVWQGNRRRWCWWRREREIFFFFLPQLNSICHVIWGLAGSSVCLAGLGSPLLFRVCVPVSVSTHLPFCLQKWHHMLFLLLRLHRSPMKRRGNLPKEKKAAVCKTI